MCVGGRKNERACGFAGELEMELINGCFNANTRSVTSINSRDRRDMAERFADVLMAGQFRPSARSLTHPPTVRVNPSSKQETTLFYSWLLKLIFLSLIILSACMCFL